MAPFILMSRILWGARFKVAPIRAGMGPQIAASPRVSAESQDDSKRRNKTCNGLRRQETEEKQGGEQGQRGGGDQDVRNRLVLHLINGEDQDPDGRRKTTTPSQVLFSNSVVYRQRALGAAFGFVAFSQTFGDSALKVWPPAHPQWDSCHQDPGSHRFDKLLLDTPTAPRRKTPAAHSVGCTWLLLLMVW